MVVLDDGKSIVVLDDERNKSDVDDVVVANELRRWLCQYVLFSQHNVRG